jgi:HEAT repeat protein
MESSSEQDARFQHLLTQLGNADYKVRREAVQALAKTYGAEAVPALIQALATEKHRNVRLRIVERLRDL